MWSSMSQEAFDRKPDPDRPWSDTGQAVNPSRPVAAGSSRSSGKRLARPGRRCGEGMDSVLENLREEDANRSTRSPRPNA